MSSHGVCLGHFHAGTQHGVQGSSEGASGRLSGHYSRWRFLHLASVNIWASWYTISRWLLQGEALLLYNSLPVLSLYLILSTGPDEVSSRLSILPTETTFSHTNSTSQCLHCECLFFIVPSNVLLYLLLSLFHLLPYLPIPPFSLHIFLSVTVQDGELCISILHPPGEDPHSGEKPEERWNPTQTVRWRELQNGLMLMYVCSVMACSCPGTWC